jgi:hypothetical protein
MNVLSLKLWRVNYSYMKLRIIDFVIFTMFITYLAMFVLFMSCSVEDRLRYIIRNRPEEEEEFIIQSTCFGDIL